jgi:hypothetical protein
MHVVQVRAMSLPERSHLRFQIDQFDAMGKPVMKMFDMLVMNAVAANKTGLHPMQQRLLDTGEFRMLEQMARHARPQEPMPHPRGMAIGGLVKIEA